MALPVMTEALTASPRKLFLFSTPKAGKTTLLSGLKNNLILDTENGSDYIKGIKVNLLQESIKQNVSIPKYLRLLSEDIKKAMQEKGDFVYDWISFDTVTGLEDIARKMATTLYKATPLGKNYGGSDIVMDGASGSGYAWLRKAFLMLYDYFEGLSRYGLIFMGHVKYSSIVKNGQELSAIDIDLTGKLKQIICSEVDGIGILRRDKDNPNMLIASFKGGEREQIMGARSSHLRNVEFPISELKGDEFIFHWDKIYLELNSNKNNKEK